MKYKTFVIVRKTVIILFTIVLVTIIFSLLCYKTSKRHSQKTVNPGSQFQTPSYENSSLSISKIDKEIFEYQRTEISSGELDNQGDSYKKSITTSDYKLDLRCDFKKGYSYWNRIKVDYNKDGNWDEKWTYQKNGKIKREVSPNDNEKYEIIYFLKSDKWEKK